MVAAHLALVDHAGEPAGARQHREQRHLRQRDRGRAVIGHHDVVGRERKLVTAAGRGAVYDGDEALAGVLAGVLQAVAGFIGEFAEVDLMGVGRARQHADVGAGAEHAVLARAHHHDLHLGVLEAQPLHNVRQLDVDAEVVGIQLQLIALEQAGVLVDVHGERRDVALHVQLPVPVPRRLGLEIDVFRPACEDAIVASHWATLQRCLFDFVGSAICTIMHVFELVQFKIQKHAFCFMFTESPVRPMT